MRQCFQSSGQDMLQHDEAVRSKFSELVAAMATGALPPGWRVPSWLTASSAPGLLQRLPALESLARYQRYHDCGKHRCLRQGPDGQQQFPGHAAASAPVWREHGGDEPVAQLIAQDRDVHLLQAEDVPEFASRPTAAGLLLTALAEVHANAALSGELDSPGFKAKLKHLDRRGQAVLKCWGAVP